MVNKFQKIIYKITCVCPIFVMLGISWLRQGMQVKIGLGLVIIGIVASIYPFIFVYLCRKNLPVIEVKVNSVSQDDKTAIACVLSYVFPFIAELFGGEIRTTLICGAIVFLFLIMQKNLMYYPFFLLSRYRCYKVGLSTGVEDCILISRDDEIRGIDKIKCVVRVDETFLIHVKD